MAKPILPSSPALEHTHSCMCGLRVRHEFRSEHMKNQTSKSNFVQALSVILIEPVHSPLLKVFGLGKPNGRQPVC